MNASLNFASALNDQFVLINHDSADALIGRFSGLAQNATLPLGSQQFRINCAGGDGNDVVLTQLTGVLRPPALTIESLPPTAVRLFWQTNAAGFMLQSNTNLATTYWTTVSPLPGPTGTNIVLTNLPAGDQRFYRLFKP